MSKRPVAETAQKRRVLIVDDHPVVRDGLARFINKEPDLSVVAEASGAHEALDAVERHDPEVVIVDLSLQGRPGIELIKDLGARFPGLPVLVLSMHDESLWAERVLAAGAGGYIMKFEATEKVVEALRRVLDGEVWVSERMSGRMLQKLSRRPRTDPPHGSPLQRLTDRELVVFQSLGLGLSVREIAARLSLSAKTVEAHREHIKEKLSLKSSVAQLRYAIVQTLEES